MIFFLVVVIIKVFREKGNPRWTDSLYVRGVGRYGEKTVSFGCLNSSYTKGIFLWKKQKKKKDYMLVGRQ